MSGSTVRGGAWPYYAPDGTWYVGTWGCDCRTHWFSEPIEVSGDVAVDLTIPTRRLTGFVTSDSVPFSGSLDLNLQNTLPYSPDCRVDITDGAYEIQIATGDYFASNDGHTSECITISE